MTTPESFAPGYRLTDGTQLNFRIANPQWSTSSSVSATSGGTMATSAKVVNAVTNITNASVSGAGVTLPQAIEGTVLLISNNSANDVRIFADGDSDINGLSGQIGILLAKGTTGIFTAVATKEWSQLNTTNSTSFTTFSTVAALRASPIIVSTIAFVEGYYTPGDGGGGYFYGVTGGSYTDNGGTIIVPPGGGTGTSAWLRYGVNSSSLAWQGGNISLTWFGARGNGVSDCSPALQQAVNFAKGNPIIVPGGTFILNSQIELNWSTAIAPTYQPGTRILGAGMDKTIFVNRSGDYAFLHSITLAQTQQAVGVRMEGGELAYFLLATDGSSPAGSAGIKLFSYWMANIHDIVLQSLDGNCLSLPQDLAYGPNPDKYSCGTVDVRNARIGPCTGWGIFANMYSITWQINKCYITGCYLGGIYTTGCAHQIINNAVAGCGNPSQPSVGGVWFSASDGIPENIYFTENEMQDNWGSHVYHEGFSCIFTQNRFLQDATVGTGGNTFRNTACVYLDGTTSQGCYDNVVKHNLYRFDSVTPSTTTLFTANIIPPDIYTKNNLFLDNQWSPSFYTSSNFVTKYVLPSGQYKNYAIEEGLQIAGSAQMPYTSNLIAIAAVAASTLHSSPASRIKLAAQYTPTINFATVFNDSLNAFVVPFTGLLRITSNGDFRPTASGVGNAAYLYVYKNGAPVHTQGIPQGFASATIIQGYTFEIVLPVIQGDLISLWAEIAAGGLYSVSTTTSTTTFEIL